ncbi:hypothetical protein HN014_17890 [Aquimarina sp. TRL1]|uniref:hypothetical protein n=1 Tax=Aquimarina sp. (strain TRL1) TaxID=2736252 RepID=UPI00158BDF52|nr:hypothetical protein [Aquimarina sp. TRL1]QKX06707.1 hypothetical protein HN014_17890 [Aquimarina sp. TRL1]
MDVFYEIPASAFEVMGLIVGFSVSIITAIQISKEYKSKEKSSLSAGYVIGWVFVYGFWALYGVRFKAEALWITNGLALVLQLVLCMIVLRKSKRAKSV